MSSQRARGMNRGATPAPQRSNRRPNPRSKARRAAARRGRAIRIGIVAVIGAGAFLGLLRVARSGSLPGLTVSGMDVGARSPDQVRARLVELRRDLAGSPIVIERAGGGPRSVFRSQVVETGVALDVDETVAAVLERGRQGNPIAALADHLRSFVSSTAVRPVLDVDTEALDRWTEDAFYSLAHGAREGDLRFARGEVAPVDPRPGTGVARGALREAAFALAVALNTDPVTLPEAEVDPRTDEGDVDAVLAEARAALRRPISLSRGETSVSIDPMVLARVLDARVTDDTDPHLELVAVPRLVKSELEDRFAPFETSAVDAGFSVSGGTVTIVPSRSGFAFDPSRAARQILRLATSQGDRAAALRGKTTQPDFTTRDARALDVKEQVSTFTTYHSCCEPRVENIHRAAALVDGTIIEPGETFSLNDAIGPRTAAGGFVAAPAISDGEFVEEVGGGISQLATTFFNAIFFAGYDFLEYQAHSYYISRYPPGREATISTPAPDLVFENDSDSGIFIDTYYTDTSITVSFYGNQDVEVESVTGPRRNVVQPEEECRENSDLARGEEVVVQEGLEGFDIIVERVFTLPDGEQETETFSTRYQALPRIVERADCNRRKEGGRGGRSRE